MTPQSPHVLDIRHAMRTERIWCRGTRRDDGVGAGRGAGARGMQKRIGESHMIRQVMPHIARCIALLVVVALGSYGVTHLSGSLAYFTDTEASNANAVSASTLALHVVGGGQESLTCGDTTVFPVTVTLDTTRTGAYTLWSEVMQPSDSALCDALTVQGTLNGESVLDETPIAGVGVSNVSSGGLWEFTVSSGDISEVADGAQCVFAVVFEAFCPSLGLYGGGYTDRGAAVFTVVKEPCEGDDDEPCEPGCCGDVSIHVENTNIDTSVVVVESSSNTGGNTIVSTEGNSTNTITTGDSSSVVTIVDGNQTNEVVIDVDASCGCGSEVTCMCRRDGVEDVMEVTQPLVEHGDIDGENADPLEDAPENEIRVTREAPALPTTDDIQAIITDRLNDRPL